MTRPDPRLPPAFAELWQAFIDGEMEAEQSAALEQLLRSDPAIASLAGERYVEHRLLALALQRDTDDRFCTATLTRVAEEGQSFSRRVQQRLTPLQTTPVTIRRWDFSRPSVIAAAGVLAALVLVALLTWPTAAGAHPLPPPTQVATVIMTDQCVWQGPHHESGQRLTTGELTLVSGTALLRFDGGADMLMTGPVALRLDSGGSAWCGHGTVTVRAAHHAAGFVMRTPVSEITDLGTEFYVSIAASGVTELQVLDGGVAWRSNAASAADPGAVLHQGQALRVRSADDRTGEPVPVTALHLDAQLKGLEVATPTTDLISYDGFAYGFSRTTSRQHNADGGSGWRSPWFRSQRTNDLPIDITTDTSLAMPDGLLPSQGGCLELPSEPGRPDTYREACMRLFARPIHLAQDDVRYVSLLVRRSPSVAGPTHYWFRCMLTSETVPDDRLGFGLSSTGCPQLLSHFGNSQSYMPIVDGQPYLFVFKLVAGRSVPAQSFLMVYGQHDQVDRHEPSVWTVVGQPGRFEGVLGSIHINNGTERAYTVDELRIGTTWQSVTPRP